MSPSGVHPDIGNEPDVLLNLFREAQAAQTAGNASGAIEGYRRCLTLQPDAAQIHNNLGTALDQARRFTEAIDCFERALAIDPNYVRALNNLGKTLRHSNRPAEAVGVLQRALSLSPGNPVSLTNLGFALIDLGRQREAIPCFEQAIAAAPGLAQAHHGLGRALRETGAYARALLGLREAARLAPGLGEVHVDWGRVLLESGDNVQAVGCFQRAVHLDAHLVEGHHFLGVALYNTGFTEAALSCFDHALELAPAYLRSHDFRGRCLAALGRLDEAIASMERAKSCWAEDCFAMAAALNCYNRMGDWNNVQRLLQQLRALPGAMGSAHTHVLALSDDPLEHMRFARVQAAAAQLGRTPLPPAPRFEHDRIRIAYVSADYRAHATAYLIAELFELHDRSQFEVFGVSIGPRDHSAAATRLTGALEHFVELADQSDGDIARWLRAQEIDIGIDLKGYTSFARPGVFAYRPAPVQVNYLGYPGTMSAAFIDYIIADPYLIPASSQSYYQEKIAYLPDSYQPNDRRRAISPVTPSRAELGLPAQGFVFCSFNNTWKILPAVFDVWMRLLSAVEGSVLWLLEDNRWASANLRRAAQRRGVAPDRLVFSPRIELAHHLARQRRADLFLDTLPCNAHTTTSDALWAGLPVVTCSGLVFPSRVAGSLLSAAGCAELATTSLTDYEQLALRLARDPALLGAIRQRLTAAPWELPLFDSPRYCRHLEAALHRMWSAHQSGRSPATFSIERLP